MDVFYNKLEPSEAISGMDVVGGRLDMVSATLVEDGDYYNCKVAKANFDGWKAAKEIVRSELPYPT